MHGLLVIDKPEGIGSTDVLRVLRRRLGRIKMGHGGTLDPFASGVLPVLLGHATRLVPFLHGRSKEYLARVRLGITTTTLDRDGDVTRELPVPSPLAQERVEETLRGFVGRIEQRVPAFSAVRVDGERLHRKARRGEEVKRPTRVVEIHALTLEALGEKELTLRVRCGTGTYIRSLAESLGEALGTVAHLTELRRTAVGPFVEARAVALDEVDVASVRRQLVPLAATLPWLDDVALDDDGLRRTRQGQKLPAATVPSTAAEGAQLRLLAPDGQLVAIAEVLPSRRGLKVVRGMPAPTGEN